MSTLDQLEQLFTDVRTLHANAYEQVCMARNAAPSLPLEDMADCAYVLNEMSKLADDMRKEAKLLSEILQRFACIRWATQPDASGEVVRGKLCTASPNIREMRHLPSREKEPEKYKALLRHFGVPEEHIESGVLHVTYPVMVDYLTKRAEQGLPPPPGLEANKAYQLYSLIMRKKGG
jgi:hypothetical protein